MSPFRPRPRPHERSRPFWLNGFDGATPAYLKPRTRVTEVPPVVPPSRVVAIHRRGELSAPGYVRQR
jgi:hypothetical protein